jgi:predicted dehydrogenase
MHFDHAKAALKAGKHVLLEKPPVMSVEQMEELIDLANGKDLVGATDFEFRNIPARRMATELLWEGKIGRLRHVEIRDFVDFWADPDSERTFSWQNTREAGGGVLGMLGSHHVDWLRVMGGEWEYVDGESRVVVPHRKDSNGMWQECTAEDYVQIRGMLEREVTAEIVVAACFHYREFVIRLFGEYGTMDIEGTGEGYGHEQLYMRMSHGERMMVDVDPALRIERRMQDWRGDLLMPHLDALARSIRGEEETGHPTFEDGLAVQRVMDSVNLRTARV